MNGTFLSQVADDLRSSGKNLADYTLIFPQAQAIEVFQAEMKGTELRMSTMDHLFRDCSGLRKADDGEMFFRIYAAYLKACDDRKPMTAEEFVPWSEMMLNDFNDVDVSLADAASVFREVNNLRDIENIKFADEETLRSLKEYFSTFYQAYGEDMRGKFHEMWNMLPAIYDEVNATAEKSTYEGAVYRRGCERMLTTTREKFIFIGFNVLCGAEKRIMRFLKDNNRAEFYWDCSKNFLRQGNTATESILRNISTLGGWTAPDARQDLRPMEIISSTTQSGEAAFVRKWLEAVAPKKGDFTAIVPMDSNIKGLLRHFLPHKNYAFSISYPISLSATYANVMRMLAAAVENGADGTAPTADEVISRMHEVISAMAEASSETESALETQALETAQNALDAVEKLIGRHPEISVTAKIVSMLFRGTYAAAECKAGPDAGEMAPEKRRVEVLSLNDTRNLDYDHILFLDCNEGMLPQSSRQPTMLPNAVRAAYGIPIPDRRGDMAAYNFYRLIKRARNVAAVYSTSTSATGGNEMSRFLLQILAGETARGYVAKTLSSPAASRIVSAQPVTKTPEMLSRIKNLEPSPLDLFVQCPLKFYYNKVARLSGPNPDPEKMPSNLFGTIFHEAIRAYYENKPTTHIERSTIEQDLADKRYPVLHKCIDEAFTICKIPENSIIRGIILRYFKDMLEYDANQAPFDIMPQYIEKFFYAPMKSNGYSVRIGGKFDRVHVKDGVYVVADYKTGKYGKVASAANFEKVTLKSDKDSHSNYVLQTMIYCLALKNKLLEDKKPYTAITPQLYFMAGVKKPDFKPDVFLNKVAVSNFDSVEQEVREALQHLVDRIFDLNEPFSPCEDEKTCMYCDFRQLCGK